MGTPPNGGVAECVAGTNTIQYALVFDSALLRLILRVEDSTYFTYSKSTIKNSKSRLAPLCHRRLQRGPIPVSPCPEVSFVRFAPSLHTPANALTALRALFFHHLAQQGDLTKPTRA